MISKQPIFRADAIKDRSIVAVIGEGMPVRYTPSGDHHERDDYSFFTRDHGSRDFARSRRFAEDDGDECRTMSLVSNPLQVPIIGRRSVSPSRRLLSPQQVYHGDGSEYCWGDNHSRYRPGTQRNRQPVASHRNCCDYDYEVESVPLQPLVPTYQPRRRQMQQQEKRHSCESPDRRHVEYHHGSDLRQENMYPDDVYQSRDVYRDDTHFQEDLHRQDQEQNWRHLQQKRQDPELQPVFNWRKRAQEPLVHTDFGYEVPTMRRRADPTLQDVDDNYKTVSGYIAKRRQFAVENDDDMQYYKNPNYQYRIHGMERPLVTNKDVEDSMERMKVDRAPMFEMKLRSHVVWEKMKVKFTCTVRGSPTPRVTWYKDLVPLEPSLHSPGKYKISHQFGLHTLEISRATIEDSGTYRVSLQNRKGEISSYATLLVRRYDGGKTGVVNVKSGYNMRKPTDYPDVEGLNIPGSAPVASKIKVMEYDELPDCDAARHFKSQLENLDFDVNKLMKEAKFYKDLRNTENKSGIESMTENLSSSIVDGALLQVRKGSDDPAKEIFSKIHGSATSNDSERRSSGTSGKGYISDVSTDNSENSTQKSRYKVAIEVSVTNENRRDSLDPFEKLIAPGKKIEFEINPTADSGERKAERIDLETSKGDYLTKKEFESNVSDC